MPPGTNKKPTICSKNPVVPLMPIKTKQGINDSIIFNNGVFSAAVLKLEEKLGCPTLKSQFFAYSYLIRCQLLCNHNPPISQTWNPRLVRMKK
jgi:hypothetical protein